MKRRSFLTTLMALACAPIAAIAAARQKSDLEFEADFKLNSELYGKYIKGQWDRGWKPLTKAQKTLLRT